MPTLILMRHAQAEPAAIDGADHERALTDAGRREVLRAAQQLRAMSALPDRALVSPALRTRETADILRDALDIDADRIAVVDALYLGTPSVLRHAIGTNGAHGSVLLVIGHNPGISELAAQLRRDTTAFNLATAGLCRIEAPVADWTEWVQ